MEEYIKELEELLNYEFNQLSEKEYQAIKNLIARNEELEKNNEIIKTIFKEYIRQYEKINTMNVGMLPTGENCIYKKIKVTQMQIDFMKEYLNKKEINRYGTSKRNN